MKLLSCTILYFIVLLYFVNYSTCTVKTNQVEIGSDYKRFWIYSSEPQSAAQSLNGPISTIIPDGDLIHFFCDLGFVTFNKTKGLVDNTSFTPYPIDTGYVSITAPILVGTRFWYYIALTGFTTLSKTGDVDFNVEEDLRLDTIFTSVQDSQYVYFIAGDGVVRFPVSDLKVASSQIWKLTGTSERILSAAYDSGNHSLYLGGSLGTIWKLNTSSFPSSVNVTSVGSPVSVILLDSERSLVYAATTGSSTNATQIFKFYSDNTEFTQLAKIKGAKTDYSVGTGAIDSRGLLYLGTKTTPGNIIQIDLSEFKYETSVLFPSDVGPLQAAYLDMETNKLFFGGQAASLYTLVAFATPADSCSNDCYGRGVCNYRYCECETFNSSYTGNLLNYTQPWCQGKECDYDCYNHGSCNTVLGSCVCNSNWTGLFCDLPQCPNNCSGHGTCEFSNSGIPIGCVCNANWKNIDCSENIYMPCPNYTDCSSCSEVPGCGWCEDSAECSFGNIEGPMDGSGCKSWHYEECPGGLQAINYVILALLIIFLLINVITYCMNSTASIQPEVRMEWYRFQRSSKTWTLIWQLQWIAAIGLIGKNFPTGFGTFTVFWYWIMLGYGLPWENRGDVSRASRNLLSLDQYFTYSNNDNDSMFYGILFWFAVVLVISVLASFAAIIIAFYRGKYSVKHMLSDSLAYVCVRILELAYFPIVVFSCLQMTSDSSPGITAVAALFFIFVGIGYPILTFLLTWKIGKNLYRPEYKNKLFPLHGIIHLFKIHWAVIIPLRKFLLGMVFGFLHNVPAAQVIFILIIQISYFGVIFKVAPFIDNLQRNLEFILIVVNICTILTIFPFVFSSLSTNGLMTVTLLFVILQILAVFSIIVFFFIIWLQMHQIHSAKQLYQFLTCQGCAKLKEKKMKNEMYSFKTKYAPTD